MKRYSTARITITLLTLGLLVTAIGYETRVMRCEDGEIVRHNRIFSYGLSFERYESFDWIPLCSVFESQKSPVIRRPENFSDIEATKTFITAETGCLINSEGGTETYVRERYYGNKKNKVVVHRYTIDFFEKTYSDYADIYNFSDGRFVDTYESAYHKDLGGSFKCEID